MHGTGHGPASASRAGPLFYWNRPARSCVPAAARQRLRPPATILPSATHRRRHPSSDRHRQPTTETAADTGLNRVPYRFATVQSGSKPQHLNGSMWHTTRAMPSGPGKGVVEARHTGARKCAEREECATWRERASRNGLLRSKKPTTTGKMRLGV